MRAFFQGLPSELLDSARVDGAGEFRILWRIVLPLSKAVVAVIGLFYAQYRSRMVALTAACEPVDEGAFSGE